MTVGFAEPLLLLMTPLIGVMDHIPDDLSVLPEASACTKLGAFFHAVFPLSISGLATGSVLVFTRTAVDYPAASRWHGYPRGDQPILINTR